MVSSLVLFVLADAEDIIDEVDEQLGGNGMEGGFIDTMKVLFMFLLHQFFVVVEVASKLTYILLFGHDLLKLLSWFMLLLINNI